MAEYNLEQEFQTYLQRLFYIRSADQYDHYDAGKIEYFIVLRIHNECNVESRTWRICYSTAEKLDELLERIRAKYGNKNVCEIFRKPIYSGAELCVSIKQHFAALKWHTKGNIIEAPPTSRFTDERVLKVIKELYGKQFEKLYNYLNVKHDWYMIANKR